MGNNRPDDLPCEIDSTINLLGPGVMLEWACDHRVALLTVTSVDRKAIDLWAETALSIVESREPDELHLVIHDVSAEGLALTPYIRKRAQEIVSGHAEINGRTAIVVREGAAAVLMRLFVNHLVRVVSGRPLQVFTTRRDALIWVAELLQKQE